MIRRLVEQSYHSTAEPSPQSIEFWLAELRSPELLIDVAERYLAGAARNSRPAVQAAIRGDRTAIEDQLEAEERTERAADGLYWDPLREDLERLRHPRRQSAKRWGRRSCRLSPWPYGPPKVMRACPNAPCILSNLR